MNPCIISYTVAIDSYKRPVTLVAMPSFNNYEHV